MIFSHFLIKIKLKSDCSLKWEIKNFCFYFALRSTCINFVPQINHL